MCPHSPHRRGGVECLAPETRVVICEKFTNVDLYPFVLRLTIGQKVHVEINGEKRRLYARLHSAGHLMDSALTKLGIDKLVPYKVVRYFQTSI